MMSLRGAFVATWQSPDQRGDFFAAARNDMWAKVSAPLVFGTLFQIGFLLIGMAPETEAMDLLVPMPQSLVTGLFAVSLLLMGGRWWLRRNHPGSV